MPAPITVELVCLNSTVHLAILRIALAFFCLLIERFQPASRFVQQPIIWRMDSALDAFQLVQYVYLLLIALNAY